MAARVIFSFILFLGLIYLYFQVQWTIETRLIHAADPDAIVSVDGEEMRTDQALCHRIAPEKKIGLVKHLLLCQYHGSPLPILYLIAALTGWCASMWVLGLQGRDAIRHETFLQFFSSLLLAPVVGVASYLLIGFLSLFNPFPETPLHERLAILPLLGGLFLRIFYEQLGGFMKDIFKWMRKTIGGAAAILLLMASPGLTPEMHAAITYWECSNPSEPKRLATSDEGKKKYPECQKWRTIIIDISKILQATTEAQKDAGIGKYPRSNFFLSAASSSIYDKTYPKTNAGFPVPAATVYESPEEYGFRVLSADESKIGSFALFGDVAGVVTGEDSDGSTTVMYPSAGSDGRIIAADSSVLGQVEGEPKYITPDSNPDFQ